MSRFMLAAMNSNSGKTTMTMALLAAYKKMQIDIRSFKTGPDYIDPMFHEKILHLTSSNLDPYMMEDDLLIHLLTKNAGDLSIIEGVMGYYDGVSTGISSSSYDLARRTQTPVVLVVRPKGLAATLAALVQGIQNFRKDANIQGILLNGVSPMMAAYYKKILEDNTGIRVYGYLPLFEEGLESRHLGLITADEIENLQDLVGTYGDQALESVDLEGLMALGQGAGDLIDSYPEVKKIGKVRLALARDRAFSFYYNDALDYLRDLGVEIVEFSPLANQAVPQDVQGVYLGGGYPELYMEDLEKNQAFLESLRDCHKKGMPIFAECGGYMTLLEGFQEGDRTYQLAGLIPGTSQMTGKLQNFGYIDLVAQEDNLLAQKGDHIRAHEFHYSKSTNPGEVFQGKKPQSQRGWSAMVQDGNLCAGYPHIHLMANPKAAHRLVEAMKKYKEMKR